MTNFSISRKGINTVKAFDPDPYTWPVILRVQFCLSKGKFYF